MPITYAIDQAAGIIRTRCRDDVTLPEVLAHFDDLAVHPDCPPRLDVLLDFRGMTSVPTSDQLRAAGEKMKGVRSKVQFGAIAIVVSSDAQFGIAQMFEVAAARMLGMSRVFRDLYEGERWLRSQREPESST